MVMPDYDNTSEAQDGKPGQGLVCTRKGIDYVETMAIRTEEGSLIGYMQMSRTLMYSNVQGRILSLSSSIDITHPAHLNPPPSKW
jgi:hypothetical protein